MKSLKESILSSNGANITSVVKDIILSDATQAKIDKLNELWKTLKLDLPDFEWTSIGRNYAYIYTKPNKKNYATDQFLWGSRFYAAPLLVAIDRPKIGMTKKLSKIYKDHLMKVLDLTEISSNEDWYYLNFK